MLKKIVVASVLSSLMGFACYETEGAVFTPRLEDQVRMPAPVPGAGAAAANAVRKMRHFGRTKSIDNFEEFLRQHPAENGAVANYIARNTAADGSAKNGKNYDQFVREWAIPSASIHQNADGTYSIDPMALDTFKEQVVKESLRAARGPADPIERQFVQDIRNEITQAGNDAVEAFEYEIQDPQTQDMRAQMARDNMLTAFENEIRGLYQPVPAAAPIIPPVAVPNGPRDHHIDMTLQAVRDAVQHYHQLPINQRADPDLDAIRSEVANQLQNEIRNLNLPVPAAAPNIPPAMPNAPRGPEAVMTLQAVRDAIQQYLQLPANQRWADPELDMIINEVQMAFENEINNPQTQDPRALAIRANIVANIH